MLTPALYADELASGQLYRPVDHNGQDGYGFWLIYRAERRNTPKIRVFRDWILSEVDRTLGPAARRPSVQDLKNP